MGQSLSPDHEADSRRRQVDPMIVRFSQATISDCFSGQGTKSVFTRSGQKDIVDPEKSRYVDDVVDDLSSGKIGIDDFPLIRVLECDGMLYTLDNRRLFIFQQYARRCAQRFFAGPIMIDVEIFQLSDIGFDICREELKKFTNRNHGLHVELKPTLHYSWRLLFGQAEELETILMNPMMVKFTQSRIPSVSTVSKSSKAPQRLNEMADWIYSRRDHQHYQDLGELCVIRVLDHMDAQSNAQFHSSLTSNTRTVSHAAMAAGVCNGVGVHVPCEGNTHNLNIDLKGKVAVLQCRTQREGGVADDLWNIISHAVLANACGVVIIVSRPLECPKYMNEFRLGKRSNLVPVVCVNQHDGDMLYNQQLSIKVGRHCGSEITLPRTAAAEYFAIENQKLYVMQQHARKCWTEQRCRLRVFTLPPGREHERGVMSRGLTLVEEQASKVFGACHLCRERWLGSGCSCFKFNLRPRDRRSERRPHRSKNTKQDDSSGSDYDDLCFILGKGSGKAIPNGKSAGKNKGNGTSIDRLSQHQYQDDIGYSAELGKGSGKAGPNGKSAGKNKGKGNSFDRRSHHQYQDYIGYSGELGKGSGKAGPNGKSAGKNTENGNSIDRFSQHQYQDNIGYSGKGKGKGKFRGRG